MTHYHSINDDIFDVSGRVMYGGGKRSGRHGLKSNAPDRFVDVSMAARFKNVHPNRNPMLSHNWYLADDVLLRDVALTLGGRTRTPCRPAMATRRDGTSTKPSLVRYQSLIRPKGYSGRCGG
ncbi:hypothetical protein N9573_02585 [Octadecabacter sp.]|nr:hypothetical protein [Octadecabacter sp.]